jgi:uncharacterized protein YbjT (DUF2867 family)
VNERFLVTGAHGCIGSWVVHELLADGVPVVALDLSSDASRLNLLVPADELSTISFVEGDITDAAIVDGAVAEHGITSVIHLAALQVPLDQGHRRRRTQCSAPPPACRSGSRSVARCSSSTPATSRVRSSPPRARMKAARPCTICPHGKSE